MKNTIIARFIILLMIGVLSFACESNQTTSEMKEEQRGQNDKVEVISSERAVLVIHGGAGTITRESMTDSLEEAYKNKLSEALLVGREVIAGGGSALDAVQAAINIMEDSPLFNAGKGAVYTHEAKNELDASIMDGKTLNAGAVAAVTNIKNPINAARAVMEKSKHVMLIGGGAEIFAKQQGLELVPAEYFATERRKKQLEKLKSSDEVKLDHSGDKKDHKYGTVGAVALDKQGNLAAGTSTGGMTNKKYGRVGDSPIIGAGTYASNETCGVSATGHGEFFIRHVVAYDIAALVEYKDMSVQAAADHVINEKLKAAGGEGGVIVLDTKGNVAMPFNTAGMYRGYITIDGEPKIFIYKD